MAMTVAVQNQSPAADKTVWLQAVAFLLSRFATESFGRALNRLHDPARDVRLQALRELRALGDPRAVDALIAYVSDRRWVDEERRGWWRERRDQARYGTRADRPWQQRGTVYGWSDERSDRWIERPEATFFDTREVAVEALGRIGDPRAVDLLLSILDSSDRGMADAAVRALGAIGDARATEPLLAILTLSARRRGVSRTTIAAALGRLGDDRMAGRIRSLVALHSNDEDLQGIAASVMREIGANGVAALAPLLASGQADVRAAACSVLGQLGDSRAAAPLLALLTDASAHVRAAAAKALGGLRINGSVEPLIGLLADDAPEVVIAAVWSLGHIGDERAIDPLVAAMIRARRLSQTFGHCYQGETLEMTTLNALGELDATSSPGIRTIVRALTPGDWPGRIEAVKGLAELGDRGDEALRVLASDPVAAVRQAATVALSRQSSWDGNA